MVAALVRQNVALQLQHLRTHPIVAAALARGVSRCMAGCSTSARVALTRWVRRPGCWCR
jgi:carbonic anhydrase